MRTVRNQKLMDQSNPSRGDAAVKQLSASSATLVADPPSWTTRAKPKGIARVPTHAVRPPEERRAYARAKLSLPLRVKRIAGQRELVASRCGPPISARAAFFFFPHNASGRALRWRSKSTWSTGLSGERHR